MLSRYGDDAARAVILYAMDGKDSFEVVRWDVNNLGVSSVHFSFWGIALYPPTDIATVSHS